MALVQFLALAILPNSPSSIFNAVNEQIIGNHTLAIVTNKIENWKYLLVEERPIVIRKWSNFQQLSIAVETYLLDLQNQTEWPKGYIAHLRRNQRTKYIFVTVDALKMTLERNAYELGLCDVTIISEGNEPKILSSPCRGAGNYALNDLKRARCMFNISFIDLPPNTIADATDNALLGYEGKLVNAVMDHLGFSVEMYRNHHEAGFGSFDPPSMLCGDIFTRTTLLALGGIYPFYERQVYADLLFGCGTMQVIWSVPSKAGPATATWYIILVSEFTLTTWLCALIFYVSLIIFTPLFEKNKMAVTGRPFFILGLLLGHTSTELAHKVFTITVIFFGIMFTNYYLAALSSKLTLPSEIPEITNMKELSDANLDLVSTPFIRRVVQSVGENTYDEAKASLSQRCRALNQSSHDVLIDIANNRTMALARHDNYVKYIYNNDPLLEDKIHFMEEPVTEFYPIIMMPKHSCLRNTIQTYFRRLCETGVGVKWFRDLTVLRKQADRDGPSKLDVDHIRGFLLLLTLGWAAAATAFALEISHHTITVIVNKLSAFLAEPRHKKQHSMQDRPPKPRKFLK